MSSQAIGCLIVPYDKTLQNNQQVITWHVFNVFLGGDHLTKNKISLKKTTTVFLFVSFCRIFNRLDSLGRICCLKTGLGRISVYLGVGVWFGLCCTSSCCSITWSAAWASEGHLGTKRLKKYKPTDVQLFLLVALFL